MDDVRLPDLETIRRFSIAVRQEHAPLAEVLEALRHDLSRLEREASPRAPRRPSRSSRSQSRRR